MTYERFEQLPVWKAAITLASQTCALTERAPFHARAGLRDQLERAAVGISNHIAQGFERDTAREALACLSSARGAAGEVRSMLHLLEALPGFGDFKEEIADLSAQAENISRQLRILTAALRPPRADSSRASGGRKRGAPDNNHEHDAFKDELRRIQQRFLPDQPDET